MYCSKCGTYCEHGMMFCPKCGNILGSNTPNNINHNNYYSTPSSQQNTQQSSNYYGVQNSQQNTQQSSNYYGVQNSQQNTQQSSNYYGVQNSQQNTQQSSNYYGAQNSQQNTQQSSNYYGVQNSQLNTQQNRSYYNSYQVNYNNTLNNQKKSSKLVLLIPLCVIFLFVGSLFFIKTINNSDEAFYFDSTDRNDVNDYTDEPDYTDETDYTSDYTNDNNSGKTTSIIDNNRQYTKNISSVSDVNSVIKEEAATFRKQCPTANNNIDISTENNLNVAGVNFCEINPQFAKELVNVFEYYYKAYPSVRGYLNNISIISGENEDSGTIAYFRPYYPTVISEYGDAVGAKLSINLMARHFLNPNNLASSMAYNSQVGHFPPNATKVSPVAHEMGHYLSFISLIKYYKLENVNFYTEKNFNTLQNVMNDFASGNYSKMMIESAYKKYVADNGNKYTFDEFRASISKYAVVRDDKGNYIYDETIAEAVHDIYLNGNNAKAASKYINAELIERLK